MESKVLAAKEQKDKKVDLFRKTMPWTGNNIPGTIIQITDKPAYFEIWNWYRRNDLWDLVFKINAISDPFSPSTGDILILPSAGFLDRLDVSNKTEIDELQEAVNDSLREDLTRPRNAVSPNQRTKASDRLEVGERSISIQSPSREINFEQRRKEIIERAAVRLERRGQFSLAQALKKEIE